MTDAESLGLVQCYLAAPGGAATARQEMAWRAFHKRHDSTIRAVLKSIHTRGCDIDDPAQDVWCVLVRLLPALVLDPDLGTLSTWVRGIVRNHARWQACRHTNRSDEVLTPELAASLLDPGTGPVGAFDRERRQEQVRAVFEEVGATLPELSYQVIVMHWIREQRVAEIVAELGVTDDRVRAIIRRAGMRLSESLLRSGLGPAL
jgi:RNA polymerase sigma factor (sigma-70 family)